MVQPRTLLKYCLFGGLEEEQVEKILPLMQQEKYDPEKTIIPEGKPNDRVYFLIKGQVAVVKKEVELSRLGEGEVFGEMEVLDIMPAVASVKSLSSVTVMYISNRALREIYKTDVKIFSFIVMNLARNLSRRLRKMDELITSSSSNQIFV